MQRQKTIAKWLAIILLLTAIIACYIAFSAIIKNKNTGGSDIAGADGSNNDKPTIVPPNDDNPTPPTPQPVYSEFPRLNEQINGLTVRHVGGEGNDVMLDSVYFAGKRHVIFYTASTQYDVKDCGIHIATFNNECLLSVTKIADASESFVCASIVENGLLVITKNAAQTKLRLLDTTCKIIGENACPLYSSYKLYVTSASARLYATDAHYLYAFTITKTLDVIRSNFVYPLDNAEVVFTVSTGTQDALFVQAAQGIGILTFSTNIGFKYQSEILNCRFMQILPHSSSGNLNFFILAKSNEGVIITSFDANLSKTSNYLFKGANAAAMAYGDGSNINVIVDNQKAIFCSHLEIQSITSLQFDSTLVTALSLNENGLPTSSADIFDTISYNAIEGEKSRFILSRNGVHCVVKLTDNAISTTVKISGKSLKTTHEPLANGVSKLSLLFDATSSNDFTQMCFGANDVFYITLP